MMLKWVAALFIIVISNGTLAQAETLSLRIHTESIPKDEKVLTRENLLKIKKFIIKGGRRETYCNMYNNNPAYETNGYCFYLDPDTGQQNINCDLAKSDFNNLTIRFKSGGRDQYREVNFQEKYIICISSSYAPDNLSVGQLRKVVLDALKEILAAMEEKKPDAEAAKAAEKEPAAKP